MGGGALPPEPAPPSAPPLDELPQPGINKVASVPVTTPEATRITSATEEMGRRMGPIVSRARLLLRSSPDGGPMDDKNKKTQEVEHDENEGEGSKSADRAYRRDVDEFLQENDP